MDHQTIIGHHNVQTHGDVHIKNITYNVNTTLTDYRLFEKILFAVKPENFVKEVLEPYCRNCIPDINKQSGELKLILQKISEQFEG